MEEGIVRVEHSGVFGVHEHRLEILGPGLWVRQ